MAVYAYPPAPPRKRLDLEIRDIRLKGALEPYSAIGEIKENLYYPLYQIKREFDDFLTQRPDLEYAIEPLTPMGNEPAFICRLMEIGKKFSVGPISALDGFLVDLALDTLKPMGRDITVALGQIIGVNYRHTLIIPENNQEYGCEIPAKPMAVASGDKLTVVSQSAAMAGAALAWGEREIDAGENPEDITTALIAHKEIRGGLINTQGSVKGWGGVIPIFLREVQKL